MACESGLPFGATGQRSGGKQPLVCSSEDGVIRQGESVRVVPVIGGGDAELSQRVGRVRRYAGVEGRPQSLLLEQNIGGDGKGVRAERMLVGGIEPPIEVAVLGRRVWNARDLLEGDPHRDAANF